MVRLRKQKNKAFGRVNGVAAKQKAQSTPTPGHQERQRPVPGSLVAPACLDLATAPITHHRCIAATYLPLSPRPCVLVLLAGRLECGQVSLKPATSLLAALVWFVLRSKDEAQPPLLKQLFTNGSDAKNLQGQLFREGTPIRDQGRGRKNSRPSAKPGDQTSRQ